MSCFDQGDVVGTLFLDSRQAFDLIDQSIHIKKLSIHQLRDSTLKLFYPYILDRHQVMDCNTGTTTPAHVNPSRTYFGACISINVSKWSAFIYGDSDYYADDATVHTHGNTPIVIESKLQQDGNYINLWCKENKNGNKLW